MVSSVNLNIFLSFSENWDLIYLVCFQSIFYSLFENGRKNRLGFMIEIFWKYEGSYAIKSISLSFQVTMCSGRKISGPGKFLLLNGWCRWKQWLSRASVLKLSLLYTKHNWKRLHWGASMFSSISWCSILLFSFSEQHGWFFLKVYPSGDLTFYCY